MSSSSNPSVIIVGAGAAGIAAATKLLENSVTNITILEAESRIGGRICSVKFGNAFVDMGAEYCDGQNGNIVYELSKEMNILHPEPKSVKSNVYYSNGTEVDSDLIQEINLFMKQYGETSDYDTTGKSVGDLFLHRYNSNLLKKYQNDPEKLKILKEAIRYSEGLIIFREGSFSWFDTSVDRDYHLCEGGLLNWGSLGFKTIIDILMKSYPDPKKKLPIEDKIHLNKKVAKIIWNTDEFITVQTLDNTTYHADYVIFTPSVGVLKEQKDTLFSPQLPLSKQNAIEATGLEGAIKVVMYFSTKWWKDTTYLFFWSDEDLKSADFPDGPKKNGISWVVQLRNISQAPENPNVLVGWITGHMVPDIEKIPLDTLKKGCAYVLNKFLGKTYNVAEIGQIMKSAWYSNENFRGTISYTKAGKYDKNLSHQKMLAEPLYGTTGKPSLLFAGEATHHIFYSTVHGAIESGYREAERIIKLCNVKK